MYSSLHTTRYTLYSVPSVPHLLNVLIVINSDVLLEVVVMRVRKLRGPVLALGAPTSKEIQQVPRRY